MMKVVIDISDGLLERVGEAVNVGSYENTQEFVSVALENQVELELSSTADSEVMTIEEAIDVKKDGGQQDLLTPEKNITRSEASTDWLLQREDYDTVQTVNPPKKVRLDDGPLWGQYNRIFPVKLTVRALANQLRKRLEDQPQDGNDDHRWISLNHFSELAADIGREHGLKIKEADENNSRGQGEKLSAALPIGDDPEKSKERFQTHFVGHAEQGGDLTGAAPHLLLVNIPEDSPGYIGITDAGLEFAELWNPLIDGDVGANKSLSGDEVAFYLQHLREHLPTEFNAMVLTSEAIKEGDNRPESLSSRIASLNKDWSEAQASTVRSGLVSRMYELGLVERERVGQRGIAYRLTNEGQEVLVHE
jgi:hypothetical protein